MTDKFNPADYLRTLTRRKRIKGPNGQEQWVEENHQYLDVKYRLLWFRQIYPEGYIETHEIQVTDKYARIEAVVYDKDPAAGGKKLGKGRRQVFASDFRDYLEKAETQAIGRALAVCGFGTQFCDDLDEEDTVADSPTSGNISKSSGQNPSSGHPSSGVPKNERSSDNDFSRLYRIASRKGLNRDDTNLIIKIKFEKDDASQLTDTEAAEIIKGIQETPKERLKEFLTRYKAAQQQENSAKQEGAARQESVA